MNETTEVGLIIEMINLFAQVSPLAILLPRDLPRFIGFIKFHHVHPNLYGAI